VITGFTSGIAVILFSSQIKDLLGLTTGPLPGDIFGKWAIYLRSLDSINWTALTLSLVCIGIIVAVRRVSARIPAPLVAMMAATVLVQLFGLPVETIGSRFGGLPAGLPHPELPAFSLQRVHELFSPALTLALLVAIESLLSAVVADGMTGDRHQPNTELVAQGIANMCSPLFGGIPAAGSLARTAINIKNGGRSPVAGMVHALTLLTVLMLFGRWASLVPMCSLAAILVVIAYHMSEWRTFRALLWAPGSDVAVLVATCGLTVVFNLSLAVQVGVVLSALVFVKRMADLTRIDPLSPTTDAPTATNAPPDPEAFNRRDLPAGVEVYDVNGPFFFGAADKLRNLMPIFSKPSKVTILRVRQVPTIDATGLHSLSRFYKECTARGTHLILSGVQPQVMEMLERWPDTETIGRKNIARNLEAALERARQLVGASAAVSVRRKGRKGKRAA
jgi:SulP family sulfate permease